MPLNLVPLLIARKNKSNLDCCYCVTVNNGKFNSRKTNKLKWIKNVYNIFVDSAKEMRKLDGIIC